MHLSSSSFPCIQGDRLKLLASMPRLRVRLRAAMEKAASWSATPDACSAHDIIQLFSLVDCQFSLAEARYVAKLAQSYGGGGGAG